MPDTPFRIDSVNVMDYGAHADGVTDDCDHIAAAAAAAVAAGRRLFFPPGTYFLAQQGYYYSMTLVENCYYWAPSGVTWLHEESVRPASGATIDGVTFQVSAGSRAISDKYLEEKTTFFTVKNCTFSRASQTDYSTAFIHGYYGHDWKITNNSFTSPTPSGVNIANISIAGGKRYTITNNTIVGGTTAILFMWSRSVNGGGIDSVIEDCIVTGNTHSDNAEEGISFDLKANSADDCGALEYDTIASVSGQDITLSSLTFPDYVGLDIIFVDGALAGQTRTITAQSGTGNKIFTVSGGVTASAGDHVVIGAPYKNNYIAYNTCAGAVGSSYSQIILYGLCFGNTIEHNTITRGKIKVESLNHTVQATSSATLTGSVYGRAPCGYNTVRDNTITDATNGKIYLEYYRLSGGSEASFVTVGNNVIDNTTPDVSALNQYFYRSGNSGTYTDGGGNTEADTAFTYDPVGEYPGTDPLITSLSVDHAAIGAQVTITGSGFGATQGTSKVYFGEYANTLGVRPCTREAASYVSWSNTSVVVTVPSMSPGLSDYTNTHHPVYIEVGALSSNRMIFYIPPVTLVDASNAAGSVLPNSTRTVENITYTQTTTRDGNKTWATTSTYNADTAANPAWGNIVKGHDVLFKDCTFIATNALIDGSDSGVVTLGSYNSGGQQECYNVTFVNCVITNNTGAGGDADGVNGVKCYHSVAGRWGDWTFVECSFGTPQTPTGSFRRAGIEIVEPVGGLSGGATSTNNVFQNLRLSDCNFEPSAWIAISLANYCRTPDFSRDILIDGCTLKGNAGTSLWGHSQVEYSGYGLEMRDCDIWQWTGSVFSLEGDATNIGGLSMAGHDCLRYFKNVKVDMTHTYSSPAPTTGADIFTVDHQEGAVWDDCDFNCGNATRSIRWATYYYANADQGFQSCRDEDFSGSTIHGYCEGAEPSTAADYWRCWNLSTPTVAYAAAVAAWPTKA